MAASDLEAMAQEQGPIWGLPNAPSTSRPYARAASATRVYRANPESLRDRRWFAADGVDRLFYERQDTAGQPAPTSSSSSATATSGASTTSSTSSTQTVLFPTSTQSSSSSSSTGTTTDVYYLVFLGVLVVLLCIAGCLTYRAVRLRRRYRTATQIAIARGGNLPPDLDREDYWGLGGLSGWTSEGIDRFAFPGGMMLEPGGRFRGFWSKIPTLWEGVVDSEKEGISEEVDWENIQPVSVQSLKDPEPVPEPPPDGPDHPTSPRFSGPRPRPPPRMTLFGHRRRSAANQQSPPPALNLVEEVDRHWEAGEPMRIAVVIKMPTEENPFELRTSTRNHSGAYRVAHRRPSSDIDEEEEDQMTGWEPGMEIGVWEGTLGSVSSSPRTDRSSHSLGKGPRGFL